MVNDLKEKLFETIKMFREGDIQIDFFCQEVINLWGDYRDFIYSKKDQAGRENTERNKFEWNNYYNANFQELIDRIHSACYSYSPTPEKKWEIDEIKLRQEIINALKNYDAQQNDK